MKSVASVIALLACSACASVSEEAPPEAPRFTPAKTVAFDAASSPREVVELPTPYPLPGQLKRLERAETPPLAGKPFERIEAANERAKIEPDADRFVNAVQVYPFMEGALYRLYAAPGQVTDIALEPGERLNSVSAGDTVRWVIGDTSSGGAAGVGNDGERTHVLVKPMAPGLSTNLVIATDRRAYHLEMRSFRETYMAAISWTYPQAELARRREGRGEERAASVVEAGVDPKALKFRYRIDGDRPSWRPVRAFDDGRQVFIQFPETIGTGEAPPLFVLSRGGKPELVNYRMRGTYYVVDRLFAAAELRLGEKRQDVVRILRTDSDGLR